MDYLKKFHRKLNGYFRHDINDSGDKEKTQEWLDFPDEDKVKVMDETIITILSSISYLNINNFKFK